jgi:hypothetical protein
MSMLFIRLQRLSPTTEVSVVGKKVKFEFGGDTWISKADGKNFMAGTFKFEDNADGNTLTLKQTYVYSTEQKPGIGGDVGWVKASGQDIVLEYKKSALEILAVK